MKRTFASILIGSILAISSLTAFAAKDIVDTAVAAGNFKTLVVALKTADLDALLANKEKLSAVLTYHVVPGKVMAKDVKAGDVATVNGKTIKITTANGVVVNMSKVTATDIDASNGVIHVIDSVLMPK